MLNSIVKELEKAEETNTEQINKYSYQIGYHSSLLEQLRKDLLEQELKMAESIFNSAKASIQCAKNVDDALNNLFPKSNYDLPPLTTYFGPFNPKYVILFKDGKPHQMIKRWNMKTGLLPDVHEVSSYCVEFGGKLTYTTCDNKQHNPPMSSSLVYVLSKSGLGNISSDDFFIDNYLNLYHCRTGLYLMLHKTAFPHTLFIHDRNIYTAKSLDKSVFNNLVNTTTLEKMFNSNDEDLMREYEKLLPSNYRKAFNHYNSFRLSPAYTTGSYNAPSTEEKEYDVLTNDQTYDEEHSLSDWDEESFDTDEYVTASKKIESKTELTKEFAAPDMVYEYDLTFDQFSDDEKSIDTVLSTDSESSSEPKIYPYPIKLKKNNPKNLKSMGFADRWRHVTEEFMDKWEDYEQFKNQ